MATITRTTKNSASISRSTRPTGNTLVVGNPIGLLLSLTYAVGVMGASVITNSLKN